MTWTQVPPNESAFGGPADEGAVAIAAGPLGVVAVGATTSYPGGDEIVVLPSAWFSVDGVTWERVPYDESVFGTNGTVIDDVVAGGPGFVAVGSSGDPHRAIVWTSSNGRDWTRFTDEALGDDSSESGFFGLTVGGPGLIGIGDRSLGGAGPFTLWATPTDDIPTEPPSP